MIYDVPVPEEYRGEHHKRAVKVLEPLMKRIALDQTTQNAPFLGSLVCAFALPLMAYLGKDGALKVVEHLKECINDHKVHGKH
jgi:hypothetical protein